MLAPVAILLAQQYQNQTGNITSTNMERQGLVYVQAVTGLMRELSAMRAAAVTEVPELKNAQAKVKSAFTVVQQLENELGPILGGQTKASFDALNKGVQDAVENPVRANGDETYTTHIAASDAALKLLGDIGDASQLSLDPELDTYHLRVLTVTVGPQYAEYLARLRDLAALTLKEGKAMPPLRTRAMERNATLISYVDPIYETSYGKGIVAFPAVAITMDMKGVDSTRETFMSILERQVLVEAPSGQVGQLLGIANAAVEKQLTLNQQVTLRLDEQLVARLARMAQEIQINFAIAGACLLVAFYFVICFYRVTKGGLALISAHLQELAQGDLRNRPIAPLGKDESALLIVDLHKVYDSMHELIRRVRHAARELANTSAEVSRASLDLSHRTEDAASNLGIQAGAMQLINDQINQSAQRTQEAAVMAGG